MPLYDFKCNECSHEEEILCKSGRKTGTCSQCGGKTVKVWSKAPATLTEIVPSYPGSLKQKAGYVHTHGDRPATKVQSGAGGCVNPK
jgi:putative FmdB family regulatory protein